MSESERLRRAIAGIDQMMKEYPYTDSEIRDIETARTHMIQRLEEIQKGNSDENR